MSDSDIHIEEQQPEEHGIRLISSEGGDGNHHRPPRKKFTPSKTVLAIGGGVILLALLLLLGAYFIPASDSPEEVSVDSSLVASQVYTDEIVTRPEHSLFGFDASEYDILEQVISRENSPAARDLLIQKGNLDGAQLNTLLAKVPNMEYFRTPPVGSQSLFIANKGEKDPAFFIFQPIKTQYWVFSLKDSIYMDVVTYEVEKRSKNFSAIVDSSLKRTISQHLKLADDVYWLLDSAMAWTLDLHHLERFSKIKMLYEETRIGETVDAVGPLSAVWIQTSQKVFAAYRFFDGKAWGYYGKEGQAMKTSFLKAPVHYARITSRFGPRLHPIKNKVKFHYGTDYATQAGSPIMAVADGEVLEAREKGLNGYYVKLAHAGGYETYYLHMQKNSFPPNVRRGKFVKQGEVIGLVGQTGGATGPHVCFHVRKDGNPIDAEQVPVTRPYKLKGVLLERFYHMRDSLDQQLNNLF